VPPRFFVRAPAPLPRLPTDAGPDYGKKYSQILTLTLVNQEATRENIRSSAAAFLADAREEDHIILFFAGHGMIDTDQRYYFATHETNLNNLKETGFPYEDLEGLLDSVKARQRLLLLDTCQSGDIYVDPAEAAKFAKKPQPVGPSPAVSVQVATAVPGTLMRGRPGMSLTEEGAASLAREMFADLSRGTGADVIAAAGGQENAGEANGKGLFTRSLLEVLRGRRGTERLPISDLRRAVTETVNKRTNGRQNPVVRAEPLDFDFPLLLRRIVPVVLSEP
jgi:hypothetical protein